MARNLLLCLLLVVAPISYVHSQDDELDELDDVGESTQSIDDLDKELDSTEKTDLDDAEVTVDAIDDPKVDTKDQKNAEGDLEDELDVDVAEEPATAEPPVAEEKAPEPEVVPPPVEEPQQEIVAPEPDPINVPEPTPVAEVVEDVPDAEFEARMARIYKQFYTGKISDSEWTQIVGTKASEKYTVQTGDTLWGMSVTFFGNGFFWPKLWQLNADYTNPHVLEPGGTIGFFAGSISQEPIVNMAEKKYAFNEPEPPKASVTEEQAKAYMANAQIPPAPRFRPVLRKIPNSIPNWTQDQRAYDDTGFSPVNQKRYTISENTLVPSYITDTYPESIGEVVEVETGGDRADLYQEVIVELDGAAEGETVTVFKVLSKMNNTHMSTSGYPVEFQGEIEIIESMGDDRYRAIVYNAIGPVEKGSKIRRGKIPVTSFTKKGPPGQASVNVVGGQFDADRRLMMINTVIYLDGGKEDGIEEGQIMTILKNPRVRNPDSISNVTKDAIAVIKIIHVSAELSTGMVLEARDDIRPGDKTGVGDKF